MLSRTVSGFTVLNKTRAEYAGRPYRFFNQNTLSFNLISVIAVLPSGKTFFSLNRIRAL
jgi:hypothetical protein